MASNDPANPADAPNLTNPTSATNTNATPSTGDVPTVPGTHVDSYVSDVVREAEPGAVPGH